MLRASKRMGVANCSTNARGLLAKRSRPGVLRSALVRLVGMKPRGDLRPDARAALRPFQRHQRLLQRLGGRSSPAAVLELAAMRVQIFRRRVEHGGTVDHRRIDKALLCLGVATRGHQQGFRLLWACARVVP